MSTDLTRNEPGRMVAALPEPTVTYLDPTGGRLVAWAEAASAANALAKALCNTTFVPRVKGPGGQMVPISVGDATAQILMGDELGLSPLASLRSVYTVHGTPALYARTMVALAQAQGHQIWTEESTPAKVTVCGQRRGSEHVERSTWTTDRARKAKYTGNPKYETNPEEMLYAKAAAEVARKIAADTLAGVPYSVEDLELEQPATRTVNRESVESKRTVSRAKPEPVEPEIPEPEVPESEDQAPADADLIDPKGSQMRAMQAAFRDANLTERADRLAFAAETVGREIGSASDLTRAEASKVIDALKEITPADPWESEAAAVAARDEAATA